MRAQETVLGHGGDMNAVAIALRFVSLVLIVVALMLLGADVVTTLDRGGQITVRSIDQVWALMDAGSIGAFKDWLEAILPSPLPGAVYSILALPGWAVFGVIGVLLAFLFGRRTADV